MKVTDLNPDAKWAIATFVIGRYKNISDPWQPWKNVTGPWNLYDTGYGCMNGNVGYAPG